MYAYLNADFGLFLHDTISRPTDFVAPMRLSSNTDIFGQYAPQGRLAGLIDDVAFRTFALEWSCDVYMPESIYAGDRGSTSFGGKMPYAVEGAGRGSDGYVGSRDDRVMVMAGGAGAYTFYDRIMNPGADAFIDLGNVDANVNVAGHQSFTPMDELTDESGQVTLTWLPPACVTPLAAYLEDVTDMPIVPYGDFDNFLGVGG